MKRKEDEKVEIADIQYSFDIKNPLKEQVNINYTNNPRKVTSYSIRKRNNSEQILWNKLTKQAQKDCMTQT